MKTLKNWAVCNKFMAWDRPLITDSGGFQVFSLGLAVKFSIKK